MTREQQHKLLWERIHNNPNDHITVRWQDHLTAQKLQRNHSPNLHGRRLEKGKGKGFGCVYEKSFVKAQVPIERVFITRKEK